MAFGQAAGPPASAKAMTELLDLLHAVGHADFRDARGPLGFNQRQAAGRFTRDEAAAFIEALQAAAEREEPVEPPAAQAGRSRPALGRVPAEELAAELQARGWQVQPPAAP